MSLSILFILSLFIYGNLSGCSLYVYTGSNYGGTEYGPFDVGDAWWAGPSGQNFPDNSVASAKLYTDGDYECTADFYGNGYPCHTLSWTLTTSDPASPALMASSPNHWISCITTHTAPITPSPTPFTGCNNSGNKDRRIGIRTTIAQYAGTNTLVLASIYSNGAWSIWKGLDNSGCDDFQEGSVDYFDDFEDITSEWEAVALYNCGNDGLMIEDVFYWDGSKQIMLWGWSSGVFGPFNQQCLKNYISSRGVYSDIWIKASDCGCEGVVFETADALGAVWTGSTPDAPPCSILVKTESQQAPVVPVTVPNPSKYAPYINTNNDFEEKLVDYLMAVIGIAALLFVSNSCLITAMVKKRISNPQYEYGKVYKTDME